jgi:hypothetical protein
MGVYNPHLPYILGEEWVPIREEDLAFSPTVNAEEIGHSFTTTSTRTLQDGRFYVKDWPPGTIVRTVQAVSVYPRHLEAETGPIRRVVIPVNSGSISGSGAFSFTSVANDLSSPTDAVYILLSTGSSATAGVGMFFAVNQYAQQLVGKRILGVNILYLASADYSSATSRLPIRVAVCSDTVGAGFVPFNPLQTFESAQPGSSLSRLRLGEVCWTFGAPPFTLPGTPVPWQFSELSRFEASTANRVYLRFQVDATAGFLEGGQFTIQYAAMEVIYCDEQRVAVGMGSYDTTASGTGTMAIGANAVPMRALPGLALNPVLASGSTYTAMVSSPDVGDILRVGTISSEKYPTLNALRELYLLSSQPGWRTLLQTPPDNHVGEQAATVETTHVLPQVTLHTSGAPLREMHVYGTQSQAPVYGSITAAQELLDGAVGGATSFPWVRFYARRWGNTTVPLLLSSTAAAGSTVSITPTEFDELDELVDGWKEITLRFDTPPSMGTGGNPSWKWSATGENVGNRWEVLAATAPALSGLPGNLLNLAAAPGPLGTSTYGAPSFGSSIELTWVSPSITAGVADSTSDAMIMFAVDPPAISGLAVSPLTQAVTGIGLDCGGVPCCVPSAILYNQLTWSLPSGTGVASDDFNRTVSGGLGSATVGGAYTLTGGASNFSVANDTGLIVGATSNRTGTLVATGVTDDESLVDIVVQSLPVSGQIHGGTVLRWADSSNFYSGEVIVTSAGAVSATIRKLVAGVATTLVTIPMLSLGGGQGSTLRLRFLVSGSLLKLRVWNPLFDEPPDWDIETSDTSLTSGANHGILALDESGTSVSVGFRNLSFGPPTYWFGYNEIQRMDPLTDWATIMQASLPSITSFNDFEARIGQLTSYRIRRVDNYGFYGPWSSTVSITTAAPGITGGDCISQGHVLVFTSNERQDGSDNLAYAEVFTGSVSEDFTFPEGSGTVLQQMYGKDFYTAFRPTERGGVQFTRTILVQAAAIAPQTLADFTGLRDMAWDQVSYICVRDEDGNRWFASITVPTATVQLNRSIYMAPVGITEVTDVPSPVDPGA